MTVQLKTAQNPRGPRPRRILNPTRLMIYGVLIVAALYYIMPLWVMVMTSLKGMPEIRLGREGTEIVDANGAPAGRITSGGFGPTVNGPIAMGYVLSHLANDGTPLTLIVRGQKLPARVVPMPFVQKRFHKP